MTRIFTTLAWFALVAIAANLIIGLMLDDLRTPNVSQETLVWARVHRLGGVAAALAVVLVNSIVVTYFVGTSRWVKEVSESYRLDPKFVAESNRIKRRTFPWATMSMLAVVGLIALGGACDPSTGQPNTEAWVTPHLMGAFVVLGFLGWASIVEWNNIHANQQVIAAVLEEVKRIREERGLE
jgi:amino acid transporter